MVTVNFINVDGQRIVAKARDGDTLLNVAQAAGMPLEGTCEGQMACSTCHVIVAAEWFAKLTPATEDEEDMLDLAAGVQGTSRLSCQILVDQTLDGLEVTIPTHVHNVQRG